MPDNNKSSDNFDPMHLIGEQATFNVAGDISELFENLVIDTERMPLLVMRNLVLFPFVAVPLPVTHELQRRVVDGAVERNEAIMISCRIEDSDVYPDKMEDIYRIGVLGKVIRVIDMPDKRAVALVQTFGRAEILDVFQSPDSLRARIRPCKEVMRKKDSRDVEGLVQTICDNFLGMLNLMPDEETAETRFTLTQIGGEPMRAVNYIAFRLPMSADDKQLILCIDNVKARLTEIAKASDICLQRFRLREEMMKRTHRDLSEGQREAFIRQQIRTLQDELGPAPEDEDFLELGDRAKAKEWNEDIQKLFEKELARLDRYSPTSPEYAIQYNYLDTLLNLPWNHVTPDEISLSKVEKILNRDHSGLEKVKERIIEQMAVLKLRGDMKVPILCLYGPPGVGKTSLGRSIAEALGREYARISLGGLHDEAEIRGHRRTYIGALPGRILSALIKTGTNNPVIVLDEIDKIASGIKGDPSTALLEVLDPEQNMKFHDNYVDVDYDLSKVLFIATANSLETISGPLRDRMEIIEINSYIKAEKITIAKKHLVPRLLVEHGFEADELTFDNEALGYIVERYTREAGVRQLEKKIGAVLRKVARLKGSGKKFEKRITRAAVREFLGVELVDLDMYENNDTPGVVTGLAWTPVGGDILFIESSLAPGKGEKLTLTGNLGDVMKESAVIALQYLKANAGSLGVDSSKFEDNTVHIHVPEGAIPKDGPSAGITMVTSLASSFTKRRVRGKLAMTGEITLRGKVLPVGGIKEKILAAKRAGITDIILCRANRKDVEDIQKRYITGLTFHYVDTIREVLDFALL